MPRVRVQELSGYCAALQPMVFALHLRLTACQTGQHRHCRLRPRLDKLVPIVHLQDKPVYYA